MREPSKILSRFLPIRKGLGKPPKGKSNYNFVGHLFAALLFGELSGYIPNQYALIQGPLWIHGLEWVEWDGAVATSMLPNNSLALYEPQDIIALFEIKARGVYGGEEVCKKSLENIRDNFRSAREVCPNLRHCIYLTLQERTPKRKGSVPYYQLTKDILQPECLAIALFHSPIENKPLSEARPYLGEWQQLLEVLQGL